MALVCLRGACVLFALFCLAIVRVGLRVEFLGGGFPSGRAHRPVGGTFLYRPRDFLGSARGTLPLCAVHSVFVCLPSTFGEDFWACARNSWERLSHRARAR